MTVTITDTTITTPAPAADTGREPAAAARDRLTDTYADAGEPWPPADPVMAASDPAMFAPLTQRENQVLNAHLFSGMYKQSIVYPPRSEPWRETSAVMDDLQEAWQAAWRAEREPEAGS